MEHGRKLARRSWRFVSSSRAFGASLVAGFFVIQAESYDEAVALASECPHLEFGTVEVRAIDVV